MSCSGYKSSSLYEQSDSVRLLGWRITRVPLKISCTFSVKRMMNLTFLINDNEAGGSSFVSNTDTVIYFAQFVKFESNRSIKWSIIPELIWPKMAIGHQVYVLFEAISPWKRSKVKSGHLNECLDTWTDIQTSVPMPGHLVQFLPTWVNSWAPELLTRNYNQYLDTWADTRTTGPISGHLSYYTDTQTSGVMSRQLAQYLDTWTNMHTLEPIYWHLG